MAEDLRLIDRWKQAREAPVAAEREADVLGPDQYVLARPAGQWEVVQAGSSSPSSRARVRAITTSPA